MKRRGPEPISRRPNSQAKRYDVGGGELLTTREIARIIGGSQHNVRQRIRQGWKGAALVLPLGERRRIGAPRVNTQVIAFKLAQKFGRRIPTVAEIEAAHPMDETTATYWRNAIIRAWEELL